MYAENFTGCCFFVGAPEDIETHLHTYKKQVMQEKTACNLLLYYCLLKDNLCRRLHEKNEATCRKMLFGHFEGRIFNAESCC